jgi:hydrogenase nickel incorporation protein HypB
MLSTTEGDDKPGKYPKAFRGSQALVISKIDLLPYVPFSISSAAEDALNIQPQLSIWPVSSLNGEGIGPWCEFLESERSTMMKEYAASAP